jgi:ribosomal protein L7/L12
MMVGARLLYSALCTIMEKAMRFLLKISGESVSTFNDRDDAYTALALVEKLAGKYGSVTEEQTLNGYRFEPFMVQHITAVGKTHKVNCIKLVRELSGAGLKEAKDFVDALTAY